MNHENEPPTGSPDSGPDVDDAVEGEGLDPEIADPRELQARDEALDAQELADAMNRFGAGDEDDEGEGELDPAALSEKMGETPLPPPPKRRPRVRKLAPSPADNVPAAPPPPPPAPPKTEELHDVPPARVTSIEVAREASRKLVEEAEAADNAADAEAVWEGPPGAEDIPQQDGAHGALEEASAPANDDAQIETPSPTDAPSGDAPQQQPDPIAVSAQPPAAADPPDQQPTETPDLPGLRVVPPAPPPKAPKKRKSSPPLRAVEVPAPPPDPVRVEQLHLRGLLEALLFVSNEPMTVAKLAQAAQAERQEVRRLLKELVQHYRSRGIRLEEVRGGFQFRTNTVYGPFIRDYTAAKPVRLTRAQIETLAIVAYRQPLTRPEIDDVRGVDSGPVLRILLERDLVRVLGKREEPGRPLIYGTSPYFLEFFGLKSVRELPTLQEFTELTDESKKTYAKKIGEEHEPELLSPDMGGLAGGEGALFPKDEPPEANDAAPSPSEGAAATEPAVGKAVPSESQPRPSEHGDSAPRDPVAGVGAAADLAAEDLVAEDGATGSETELKPEAARAAPLAAGESEASPLGEEAVAANSDDSPSAAPSPRPLPTAELPASEGAEASEARPQPAEPSKEE